LLSREEYRTAIALPNGKLVNKLDQTDYTEKTDLESVRHRGIGIFTKELLWFGGEGKMAWDVAGTDKSQQTP